MNTWNDLNPKGFGGRYFIVASPVGVCYASGKAVRTPSSHLSHRPSHLSHRACSTALQTAARSRSLLWNGNNLCQERLTATYQVWSTYPSIWLDLSGRKQAVTHVLWQETSFVCSVRYELEKGCSVKCISAYVCMLYAAYVYLSLVLDPFFNVSHHALIGGDLCPSMMLKIMERIFMTTACHASAEAIVCQTRDEPHEARKVEFR